MENISYAFYINLDKREDRRKQIEEECRRMEINIERFPAIERSGGILGCSLSHLAVLKKARDLNLSNVLIFEDDFEFIVNKETFTTQLKTFFQSKIDYDVLFLSYHIRGGTEPINETVSRSADIQSASGYIVHQKFYDKLIENLEEGYKLLEGTNQYSLYANDQYWKSLQKTHNFLYFNTRIGKQRPSFSDLLQCYVDYGV